MTSTDTGRMVALPRSTFSHLRKALSDDGDRSNAARLLYDTGVAAGQSLFDDFTENLNGDPSVLPAGEFWRELTEFMAEHGWGELRHDRVHSGLGLVQAERWGESDPEGQAEEPCCAFTTGMLSHLFSRFAGSRIDVVEVSCCTRGDHDCSFAFGSEDGVNRLKALLLENDRLDTALGEL